MSDRVDTDAIAARLNAARLSLEGRSREANAFAPSDAETYALYAVQEYVGDIAALLAEVATLQKNYQLLMESHQGMANENLRLGGIIQALREALQPFAALLNKAHRNRPDESPFYCVDDAEITVGDLRKAWAVSRLTEEPK